MSKKYVSDTAAAKSISAYVILNKKGELVAKVQAHFSDGGTCTVNVFDWHGKGFQRATASGYGYDKFAAALSGLEIDGVKIVDHGNSAKQEYKCDKTGRPRGKKLPPDVSGANYSSETKDFTSWYIEPGLRRLEKRGYTVIQAI